MELHLRRTQNSKKGILSGSGLEFVLNAKLTLTDDEKQLLEKYNVCLPALYWIEPSDPETGKTKYFYAYDFVNGIEFKRDRIALIANLEGDIRKVPDKLAWHLKLAKEWNGEEVIKPGAT